MVDHFKFLIKVVTTSLSLVYFVNLYTLV